MLPIKKRILSILILLIPVISFSQKAQLKDIDLKISKNEIIINYNIADGLEENHHIGFYLLDKKRNFYIPENISGDIGPNTSSGYKTLSFDMLNQTFPLARELHPALILDHNYKNGPKTVLLSALMPGLGDYFVEDSKEMTIKPYYRTMIFGGFVALALIANSNRLSNSSLYYEKITSFQTTKWVYDTSSNSLEFQDDWETFTTTYKKSNSDIYWLFKNDTEIFLGVAAGIWIFDIVWVYTKGRRNQIIKRSLSNKNYSFNLTGTGFSCKINLN